MATSCQFPGSHLELLAVKHVVLPSADAKKSIVKGHQWPVRQLHPFNSIRHNYAVIFSLIIYICTLSTLILSP